MFKDFVFYLSMLPMTAGILVAIALATILVATGVAAIILGIAYAMVPAPTGLQDMTYVLLTVLGMGLGILLSALAIT